MRASLGIHHVSIIGRDPIATMRFLIDGIGLRLVHRTVQPEDPSAYRLVFGDRTGTPGTLLEYRFDRGAERVEAGGERVARIAFAVPPGTIARWRDRIAARGARVTEHAAEAGDGPIGGAWIEFGDPDGTPMAMVESADAAGGSVLEHPEIPADMQSRGIAAITMEVSMPEDAAAFLRRGLSAAAWDAAPPVRAGEPPTSLWVRVGRTWVAVRRRLGAATPPGGGSVVRVAWRVADGEALAAAVDALRSAGGEPGAIHDGGGWTMATATVPGGIAVAVATDGPGFSGRIPESQLGRTLFLPPELASRREEIESALVPGTAQFDRVLRVVYEPLPVVGG